MNKVFLKPKQITDNLKPNTLNYVVAQMGSGKTTAIKEIIKERSSQGLGVHVFSPYCASNKEYTSLNKGLDKDEEHYKISTDYFTQFVEKLCKENKTKKELFEAINKFVNDRLEVGSIIVFDELDFFGTQARANWDKVLFFDKESGEAFLYKTVLLGVLIKICQSDLECIGVSANKFDCFDTITNKSLKRFLDVDSLTIPIRYIETKMKSNLNISKFVVVCFTDTTGEFVDDEGNIKKTNRVNKQRATGAIIRGQKLDKESLFLNCQTEKFAQSYLRWFKELNATIYIRKENLKTQWCKYSNDMTIGDGSDYDGYKFIDNNTNLSDKSFERSRYVAVNLSSSRAISLTISDKKAFTYIFDSHISASTLQFAGRFRNADNTVVLVTFGKTIEQVKKELWKYDPDLMSSFESVTEYHDVKDLEDYDNIEGIPFSDLSGSKVKKNAKIEPMVEFFQSLGDNHKGVGSFVDYCAFLKQRGRKPEISEGTFYNYKSEYFSKEYKENRATRLIETAVNSLKRHTEKYSESTVMPKWLKQKLKNTSDEVEKIIANNKMAKYIWINFAKDRFSEEIVI